MNLRYQRSIMFTQTLFWYSGPQHSYTANLIGTILALFERAMSHPKEKWRYGLQRSDSCHIVQADTRFPSWWALAKSSSWRLLGLLWLTVDVTYQPKYGTILIIFFSFPFRRCHLANGWCIFEALSLLCPNQSLPFPFPPTRYYNFPWGLSPGIQKDIWLDSSPHVFPRLNWFILTFLLKAESL